MLELVGRVDELARLRDLLDSVLVEGSRLALVGGDAGSGKTTVVDAFVRDLATTAADRGAQVIRGQCVPLGGDGLPYAPIVGALRELIARHGRDQVLEWAGASRVGLGALLPDLIAPPRDLEGLRLQLFEAVARLWESAAQTGPLVVVIEDLHWADESTRHLLRFLTGALTEAPVLVIATYRTDELDRRHPLRPFLAEVGRLAGVTRLEIGGLSRAEVADLLTRLLGRTPSGVAVDLVHRRSEGLPYFVTELATSASRGCVDMPDTLRDALNVRVQRLSDRAQETLQVAAVAGPRVEHALLEAISDRSPAELDTDLREAVDVGVLIVDEDGYLFRHALLREVVHEDMLPGRHSRLHARFAALLEERPELATGTASVEIAHHWSAAHDVDKAFRWSLTGGRGRFVGPLRGAEDVRTGPGAVGPGGRPRAGRGIARVPAGSGRGHRPGRGRDRAVSRPHQAGAGRDPRRRPRRRRHPPLDRARPAAVEPDAPRRHRVAPDRRRPAARRRGGRSSGPGC